MFDFTHQVALVTGSGSGIGRATALAFAQAGAQVIVSDINEESGQETCRLIAGQGGEVHFIACDVGQPEQITALIDQTVAHYGRLDVAVNNAGIGGKFARITEQSATDWDQMIAVNLSSVFYCLQAEIRQMLTQGSGKIVNVASIAGVRGLPKSAPYTAAKHAVIGLTKATAAEYVRQNIRINAICPVYTRSAMVDGLLSVAPGMEEKLLQVIPMGRFGQPEEIAQAILWLCSDANAFCTGQAIQLDGGMTAM